MDCISTHSLAMKYAPVLLLTLLLLGCQSLQSQNEAARERERQRRAVVVTDQAERVSGCRPLTDVSVAPPFPFMRQAFPELSSFGKEEVTKAFRHQTLEAGGDTVLRTGQEDGTARGTVYRCGTRES